MFQPIDDHHEDGQDAHGGSLPFNLAAALGLDLPDGITAEDFNAFLFQSAMLNNGRQKLNHINRMEQVVDLIRASSNILVLTGAGISVSAGIPDFRSENGLYATLKDRFNLDEPSTMFDMDYFIKDPSLFYSFGGDICAGLDDECIKYYPTPTHYFIRLLEKNGKLLRNYTQNIDTLEYRAGINNVITCHGSYVTASCINCQFQISGIHIQRHIISKEIPFCPYCCPQKSDLLPLIKLYEEDTDNTLRKHQAMISYNEYGNIMQIRIPKILSSFKHLHTGCPVLFSFDENQLSKAIFDADELEEHDDVNMNLRVLVLQSKDKQVLQICADAMMQWLQTETPSFGVMKPDIVFFSEALSVNYHSTLEEDVKKCDLLLVIGTSLQVQPVSHIPNKVPANVPAVLINREKVGFPNEFDVNLLGNCDDVCQTLVEKLQWQFMQPVKHTTDAKQEQDDDGDVKVEEKPPAMNANGNGRHHPNVKPIATVGASAKVSEFEFVEPNYYVFPNGKLPACFYDEDGDRIDPNRDRIPSDVDLVVDDIVREEQEREKLVSEEHINEKVNANEEAVTYGSF